ncbi:MAG: Na+/H+ antiporter NhaC family protein [Lachnospira sp.]|nr:Na+/H+ antiporter NhaC family protein [Lachnospira sp.]
MNTLNTKNTSPYALLPIAVFLIIYMGAGIIFKDFYSMPAVTAFLTALIVAFLQNRSVSFSDKLTVAAKGLADENILTMCLVFLAAGAFSGAINAAGGVESTVNLGLHFLPASLAVVGLFLIGCFISLAMGTSVGTISALAPIAIGISEKTGINMALCLGAVVSGAMFGDNLSLISDTTIAATKTQGCAMRDKFKTNLFIVLPAAIVTIVVLFFMASGSSAAIAKSGEYSLLSVIPYIFVLAGALCGMNVFTVLIIGTVLSLIAGIITGNISGIEIFTCMGDGITSMYDITIISIIVSCIGSLVKLGGGVDWILNTVNRRIKTNKGARLGIGALTAGVDIATANNTIAIIMTAPIAKEISREYNISPKESASLLDISASITQGLLPYGAQLLYASAATAGSSVTLSGFDIIPFCFYPMFMIVCLAIWIIFSKNKAN